MKITPHIAKKYYEDLKQGDLVRFKQNAFNPDDDYFSVFLEDWKCLNGQIVTVVRTEDDKIIISWGEHEELFFYSYRFELK